MPTRSSPSATHSQAGGPGNGVSGENAHLSAGYENTTEDDLAHWRLREAVAAMQRAIGIGTGETFLEMGCGAGEIGTLLAPLVGTWIGCDPVPGTLERAARKLLGLQNVRLAQSAADGTLGFIADKTADVVYGLAGFARLDAPLRSRAMAEAYRVLKTGGRFYCECPDLASPEGWQVFETARSLAGRPTTNVNVPHCSTTMELETLLTRAGFVDVQVKSWAGQLHGWGVKRA
jgi:SAM-dependent methyltransferase